jgi:hypothetical protein
MLYQSDNSQSWLDDITKEIGSVKQQLTNFDAYTSERKDGWQKQSLIDAKDLADWRNGNNIFGAHLEVDPYYKQ